MSDDILKTSDILNEGVLEILDEKIKELKKNLFKELIRDLIKIADTWIRKGYYTRGGYNIKYLLEDKRLDSEELYEYLIKTIDDFNFVHVNFGFFLSRITDGIRGFEINMGEGIIVEYERITKEEEVREYGDKYRVIKYFPK